MPNPREIHMHMRSIKNIQQITKAMKMVAAARLRRAQEKAASSRPFAEKIQSMLLTAVNDKFALQNISPADVPLLEQRPIRKLGYIVITSDKGLAGPYNSNVLKHAVMELMDKDEYTLITVGRKAKEYFTRRGYDVTKDFFGLSDKPTFAYADHIADEACRLFTSGAVDEVILIYTKFKSALAFTPISLHLLPVVTPQVNDAGKGSEGTGFQGSIGGDVIFEPSTVDTLKYLVPYYVKTVIYAALMQSCASELGARMTAMSSATDNANDLLKALELSYNKARQAGVTREINEIVGGAEALQQD
jgi:F-type H+-transporting ATPase subunit gamma